MSGPVLSWSAWAPLSPLLEAGFALGSLFTEAAWHLAATTVYKTCRGLVQKLHPLEPNYTNYKLETLYRLLHSLASFCKFKDAEPVAYQIEMCLRANQEFKGLSPLTFPNLAAVYNELSSFRSGMSEYQQSYDWAMLALQALVPASPLKIVIDVTRQASKACTVKREFRKAEMLVKHSLLLAKATFGVEHVKYADCLINYGFYLLNVDRISASVEVFRNARDIRLKCFGKKNLQVCRFYQKSEESIQQMIIPRWLRPTKTWRMPPMWRSTAPASPILNLPAKCSFFLLGQICYNFLCRNV